MTEFWERDLLGFQRDDFYPVVKDYVEATWVKNSFNFDGTDNVFTGDATSSNIFNNAMAGANAKFTLSFWVKRTGSSASTVCICHDDSTVTTRRQFIAFYNASNKFQVNFFTNSTNNIAWTSTASFTELREWNHWTIVYDGTQSATSRVTVYRNAIAEAGSTTQTGTFTTIQSVTTPNVEVGSRVSAALFSTIKIAQVSLYNTNLGAARIATLYNTRVPFDERNQGNNDLVFFLSADQSASFSSSWTWTDLAGGSVFTSSGMVQADLVNDAPALKQITVIALHGQSNASGRVKMWELEPHLRGSLNWCKVWDGTNFVNINSATNNNQYFDNVSANEFGIEFYLAEYLNRRYGKTIYFYKMARGSSYLDSSSVPSWSRNPQGLLFGQLITDIAAIRTWELANGYTITKYRFIWIQGEADAQTAADANDYNPNYTSFIQGVANSSYFNRILDNFYIQGKYYDCLLSPNQTASSQAFRSTVNTAKTDVAATDTTNFRTVNTDGCLVASDLIHYNKSGIKTIAERVGEKIHLDGI